MCVENRTWQQLVSTYSADTIKSGGLGPLSSEAFGVWACLAYHPCLSFLSHEHGDMMCYVFNQQESHWYLWCLRSDMQNCNNISTNITDWQESTSQPDLSIPPVWTSVQQINYEVETGFMPDDQHKEHTLIMALTFPPKKYSSVLNRQWLLSYGQNQDAVGWHLVGKQLWIWEGTQEYDETAAVYKKIVIQIGASGVFDIVGYQNGLQIPAGQVITICTVSRADGGFSLYMNGSKPSILEFNVGTAASSANIHFSYATSLVTTGTCPDREYPGEQFQGVIHETRLYNMALSEKQVHEINNELHAKYNLI